MTSCSGTLAPPACPACYHSDMPPADSHVDRHIDYVEFCAPDLAVVKKFYAAVFGWAFTNWGDDYCDFQGAGLGGGFRKGQTPAVGGTLVVIYAAELEGAQQRVEAAGGNISKAIFSFPGGRRFHYIDPSGNELGVWSDK